MRLKLVNRLQRQKDGLPHDFYAWLPTKINGELVWLEKCWYRWIPPCGPDVIPACYADITGYFVYGSCINNVGQAEEG